MNPIHDFKGRVALVTDASSGIGLATAKACAEADAAVALAARNEDALRTATEELTAVTPFTARSRNAPHSTIPGASR